MIGDVKPHNEISLLFPEIV
jgi:hypothetical protein